MDDLLKQISDYAYHLKIVGQWQIAGDYDYLVAWMNSTKWNNGEHLLPNPAGKNTVDEYSHNCPIPFYNPSAYSECDDKNYALYLLESIRDLINEISSSVTDEIEVTALNAYKEYTNNVIERFGGEPGPGPEPPGPTPVNKQALFGILSATSDTKFEFGDDELYGIMYKDIDIDTTFGSSITIPEGYRIESVKSRWTFEFNTAELLSDSVVIKGKGQDQYCKGDLSSAIGLKVLPCLYIFQVTVVNNDNSIGGYRISVPPSKYASNCPSAIAETATNVNGNFFELRAYYNDSTYKQAIYTAIHNYNYPSTVHYHDETDTEIFFLDLPQAFWKYDDGVFSWLGDPEDRSSLAFYYRKCVPDGTPVRIHCVHE